MDSWEKLPAPLDKNLYYSKTNDSNISDEDLNHVKNVCNTYKITNLGNIMTYMYNQIAHYLLMYLKTLEISA